MSIPKYIINLDELKAALEKTIELNVTVQGGGMEGVSDYLERIIESLRQIVRRREFTQKNIGLHSYIPALCFDYELTHTFDEDVYLTGITYSQTGWKATDCFSLYVGNELLFKEVPTKELGEYKHFNVFHYVKANKAVTILHHNRSGNSKQVWFDIGYLTDPANTVHDMPNGRDYIIKIEWLNGADIDCCWANGDTGEYLVVWNRREYGEGGSKIFLDADVVSSNGSEICSLEGKPIDAPILWGASWHNKTGPRNAEITVTLYDGSYNVLDTVTSLQGADLPVSRGDSGGYLFIYKFYEDTYGNMIWEKI